MEQDDKSKKFTCNIGNLPPGKEVLLVIGIHNMHMFSPILVYVTELDFVDGKLRLRLPETPYPPGTGSKFVLPKQKDGKYDKEVGYGLRINIDLGNNDYMCLEFSLSLASHT